MQLKIDQQITFLTTDKIEETTHFFENILELELALDKGGCRIYKVSSDAFIGVCDRPRHEDGCDHLVLTFVTDKVDEWHEKLKDKGIKISKAPAYNPDYDIYHMFFRDPNGYQFEIQEFKDPKWLK